MDAIMSMGLLTDASAGSIARSVAFVSSRSCGSSSPFASQASAQRMPRPPALVNTATRLPVGSGWFANSVEISNSSSSVSARMTPACLNSASTATSDPARAAVCEAAARRPDVLRPPFTAKIGLRAPTRRAMRANRRGLPKDSR